MLYSLGSNGCGQLGIGHHDDVSTPTKCILNVATAITSFSPQSLVAGGNHTLFSLTGGTYASGISSDGRCGNLGKKNQKDDDSSDASKFSIVGIKDSESSQPMDCSLCAATWESTAFVSIDRRRIYTCGSGPKGELGQGAGVFVSTHTNCILNLDGTDNTVVDISASMSHTVAVLSDGSVYGWGVGRKGQLAEPKENILSPRAIDGLPFKAVRAVCGKEFTYIVSDPKDGRHIVLGSDKWKVQSAAPSSVKDWADIGASWGGIYVLYTSGVLNGWGRNDHGQLPPPGLPLIDRFAAGSEHVVAKTRTGEALAWGWGEHGNCGDQQAFLGEEVRKWSTLPSKGRVTFVGAGCATSWLWCIDDS